MARPRCNNHDVMYEPFARISGAMHISNSICVGGACLWFSQRAMQTRILEVFFLWGGRSPTNDLLLAVDHVVLLLVGTG